VIVTLPILIGTDGVNRMSKSLGNYIGISEPPAAMFGKLMSIPDALIFHYCQLATSLSTAELAGVEQRLQAGGVNPRDTKAALAENVVRLYHGPEAAAAARREFDRVFRDGGLPDEMPEIRLKTPEDGLWIVQLLRTPGSSPRAVKPAA